MDAPPDCSGSLRAVCIGCSKGLSETIPFILYRNGQNRFENDRFHLVKLGQ
jgi:hypothetical protein